MLFLIPLNVNEAKKQEFIIVISITIIINNDNKVIKKNITLYNRYKLGCDYPKCMCLLIDSG